MLLLTQNVVSSNITDVTFDDINIFDGIRQLSEFFQDLPNKLPAFQRVGSFMGLCLKTFPAKFWFCMIIVVICLVLGRILRRF